MRAAAALACAGLLAACAVRPPVAPSGPPQAAWVEHRERLVMLDTWTLEGRVSVRSGDEGGSASLSWQESPAQAVLRAAGPLGAGSFTLRRDDAGAVLETADGKRRHATDVDELVQLAFGADVPVRALAWWVRGLPAPDAVDALTLDEYGRLAHLEQAGWQIEYPDYAATVPVLPRRLNARRGETEVRLAIRRWQPGVGP